MHPCPTPGVLQGKTFFFFFFSKGCPKENLPSSALVHA